MILHDIVPAHKARIVTDFLETEKVTGLPYSPDLPHPPATIFSFQNLNLIYLEGDTFEKCPWICYLSVSDGFPH